MSKVTAKSVLAGISLLVILILALAACAGSKPTPAPVSRPLPVPTPTLNPAPVPAPNPTPILSPVPTPTKPAPAPKSTGRIRPTWIKAEVSGNTASIPVSEVQNNQMSHFKVGTGAGDISFMAYELENKLYVRSDICPPCRSESFSLNKDTLVCDTCGTVFAAKTGAGIQGACVIFPKAAVSYEVTDGKMVMKDSDLLTAYQETLKPKPQR